MKKQMLQTKKYFLYIAWDDTYKRIVFTKTCKYVQRTKEWKQLREIANAYGATRLGYYTND